MLLRYENGKFADSHIGFDFLKDNSACIIGDKGRIVFGNWFFCTCSVKLYDELGNLVAEPAITHDCNGYEYEVREVERCLNENKKQSDINPLWQTRAVLEIMDNCRKQWNLKFDGE